jgi:hypothetical protein
MNPQLSPMPIHVPGDGYAPVTRSVPGRFVQGRMERHLYNATLTSGQATLADADLGPGNLARFRKEER